MIPTKKGVEDVNIGIDEKPKMVKLSKYLTPEMKGKYTTLLAEFSNVFSWDYYDFKAYDTGIIQHTLLVKPDHKIFRKKLSKINPRLLPSIEKESNKLYKAGIIIPLRFSDWM